MKAQTEIFGLAIVVLLLSVWLLFAIGFMAKKEPANREFAQIEIGYNLLSAMLGTTTGCSGLTVTELIEDCAENNEINCGSDADPLYSCTYVRGFIENEILIKTLNIWRYNYYLVISTPAIAPIGEQCQGEKRAFIYLIPTDVGDVKATLYLCG